MDDNLLGYEFYGRWLWSEVRSPYEKEVMSDGKKLDSVSDNRSKNTIRIYGHGAQASQPLSTPNWPWVRNEPMQTNHLCN